MELCTVCQLNGKEKALYELMSLRLKNKKQCAWCGIPLKKNLRATFNMVFVQPRSEIGIDRTANFEPVCDPCYAHQSAKSDYTESKYYVNYDVNRKIICSRCDEVLSHDSSKYFYGSTSSIEQYNNSIIRKLFDCFCFNCS